MRFGLKLWSTNSDTLPEAEQLINQDVFHYIELTPVPETDISPFLAYDLPYTIHITTERHGMNIANKNNHDFSLGIIYDCIEWANELDAKYMVLHPGFGEIEHAIDLLNILDDERILIENMPKTGMNNEVMVGYLPEQIEKLMNNKFGFCFDLNHAIKAAIGLGTEYKAFIDSFQTLSPFYYHISDGDLNVEIDQHLNIGEGEYDLKYLMKSLNAGSKTYMTIETPRIDIHSLEEDSINVQRLKGIIDSL
ncbi:sugar phosphate isomerase/epimerase family protein [Methanomethylovorans sp.]|uniref:sugar phosphate isomerase/epimerase family protein n=1 Tax=Methanomethylovorans sp. TaxID=2758717 RepID=UPI002FDE13D9